METTLLRAAFFGNFGAGDERLHQVYGAERMERLGRMTRLVPGVVSSANMEERLPELRDLEVIFSTWGMLTLTEAQLAQLPRLRAVFYAAGSVRQFAEPLLRRGITVVNASAANGVPVAEFTLAQILLAGKGYWRNVREYGGAEDFRTAFHGRGNLDATVTLLGAGQIGRKLVELLRPFSLRVLMFDPFLSAEAAESMGVEKVGLEEAFARGTVVSNHLANVPETVGMLGGALFAALPPNGTFINTGRGATVNEPEMIEVLQVRPDITALLDVTDPEPCPRDSPLRALPNVTLTSHIAGAIGDEVRRLADMAIAEFERFVNGEPLQYAVTLEMLETMA